MKLIQLIQLIRDLWTWANEPPDTATPYPRVPKKEDKRTPK